MAHIALKQTAHHPYRCALCHVIMEASLSDVYYRVKFSPTSFIVLDLSIILSEKIV